MSATPEATINTVMIFKAIARLISAFGIWGWVDILGASILLFGCGGELWLLLNKLPEHNERRASLKGCWMFLDRAESIIRLIGVRLNFIRPRKFSDLKEHLLEGFFISLVAIGVGMEMCSLPFSLSESAKSNELAGQAKESASKFEREAGELYKVGEQAKEATTKALVELEKAKTEREKAESGRLELEKQVLELVKKTKARIISPKGTADLTFQLNGVPKGNVEIIMSDRDAECMAFGLEIKKSLLAAGFPRVDFSPRDIFRVVEMVPETANSGKDLLFGVKNSSHPPLCSVITLNCLNINGINASGWPYNDGLSTNDFQIFVLPKPVHPEE